MSPARVLVIAALCALTVVSETHADSATAVIAVSASVRRNCIITTDPLAYGSYDPVGANATSPLDATATIRLTCTKGTSATIGLDNGSNAQGTTRRLANGGIGYLTYELYSDSSHSTVWRNFGSGVVDAGMAPNKNPRPFVVYGRIVGGQDAAVGTYRDSVVATVNF
jgi:spore coat protein U-like protein